MSLSTSSSNVSCQLKRIFYHYQPVFCFINYFYIKHHIKKIVTRESHLPVPLRPGSSSEGLSGFCGRSQGLVFSLLFGLTNKNK